MKKLIILIAIAAILLGGYTALWHKNAAHLKEDVEKGTVDLNKELGHDALSYASIDTSGYPGNITLKVKDAKFQLADNFDIHTDALDIARGFLNNTFTSRMDNLYLTFPQITPDDKPVQLHIKSANDAYTLLTFRENQLMNFLSGKLSMQPVQNITLNWKKALENFQSYEFKNSSLEIIDENTGNTILTSGPARTKLVIEPTGPISHKIDLEVSVVDQKFTPKFESLIQTIAKQIEQATSMNVTDFYALNLSSLGNINLDLHTIYNGRTDFSTDNVTDWQSNLVISKFDYSDRMESGKMDGNFLVKTKEGAKNNDQLVGSIDFKGSFLASPEMKDYLKQHYTEVANVLIANPPKNLEANQEYQLQALMAHYLVKYADLIIPDIAKMGEIKSALDVKFDIENQSFLLNDLSTAMNTYAIILKSIGNFELAGNPKGIMDITLKNYELLVSDLVDYAAKIVQIYNEETHAKMNIDLNDAFKKKLTTFLNTVATKSESDSNNMTIKISIDGDNVKIGGMDANQALMGLMMTLGQP